MISYQKHCARCKTKTLAALRNLPDYMEIYCTVCDGPSTRISYEKAWERITRALEDVNPDEEPTEESPT